MAPSAWAQCRTLRLGDGGFFHLNRASSGLGDPSLVILGPGDGARGPYPKRSCCPALKTWPVSVVDKQGSKPIMLYSNLTVQLSRRAYSVPRPSSNPLDVWSNLPTSTCAQAAPTLP